MKEKDNSKCKEWERRRRGKINDAFKSLCQLLPNYDPAKNLAKIDILERSTDFVKELRLSNSRLLSKQAETDEKCKLIKDLQDEVNKLILRVKQLTILLKQASIPIPLGPSIKSLGKKKLKWSDKLIPENLENSSASTIVLDITRNGSKDTIISNTIEDSNIPNAPTLINPLKEPNIDLVSGKDAIPTLAPNLPNISILEAPRSSTTQLPLQTIILTSCPITPVVNQAPQMITRIALGPTRILPKPPDGISPLHKIPIRQIRKPLPPKEKKKRRRKKKLVIEKADAETQSQSKPNESTESLNNTTEIVTVSLVDKINEEIVPINNQVLAIVDDIQCSEELIVTLNSSLTGDDKSKDKYPDASANDQVETTARISSIEVVREVENTTENLDVENVPKTLEPHTTALIETMMEVDISMEQEVEVSIYIEENSKKLTSTTSTVIEIDESNKEIVERPENSIEEIEIEPITEVPNGQTEDLSKQSNTSYMDISDFPHSKTSIKQNEMQNPNIVHKVVDKIQTEDDIIPETCKISQSSEIEQHSESEPMAVDIQSNPITNPETNSAICDTVNGDKISECIARSIDLIDGPEGELMELAGNWGEHVHSPKSPISPTQMFLSMFPLLPRELIVAVSESSQQNHNKNQYTPHRSFFIDSMLPEDHSVSSSIGSCNSQNPVIVPLIPSRSISLVPPSTSVQDSIGFRLTEISPINTSIPKASTSESSVQSSHRTNSKHLESSEASVIPSKKSMELNSQIQQSTSRDPNMFEFNHFQPASDYTDNTFKDVSRNRPTTECRHAPVFSGSSVRSALNNNPVDFVQPVLSTSFQHQMHQTPASTAVVERVHQQFTPQDLQQPSVQTVPSVRTHPSIPPQTSSFIPQPSHIQSHTSTITRSNNQNSHVTSLQETQGTFSYSIDHTLRHSYNEAIPSQKQSNNAAFKPQLFRPPVGDFQQQPVHHSLQQTFFSSKPPVVVNKPVRTNADVSKRQKANQVVQPQVLQTSQSQVPQMLNKHNYDSISNLTHGHTRSQSQPQYQISGIHIEKQPVSTSSSQHSRNYIQQKSSATESSNKSYQKAQNKDSNTNLTRSSPACQSRRHHAATSTTGIMNPIAEVSNSLITNNRNQQQPASITVQQTRLPETNTRSQAQTVTSFPDFSLSNFNQPQPYEPYNITYTPSGNSQPPQSNTILPSRKSTRPTPFYLQDVQTHCESFNFDASSNNTITNQQVPNPSYNALKSQYSNTAHTPSSSINPNQNSTPHYFIGSSQTQAASTCQGTYTHQTSTNISSRSQQNHSVNIAEANLLYNPNQHHNPNQHQDIPQTKGKPVSSTSSQPQIHQANYANSGTGNLSNINSSSTSASRPVNWMTDTPYRNSKSSPSTANNNAVTTNPFSVSKLVGNTSTQSNTNITNPNTSVNSNNSRSNTCVNRNTNYCAEALIRKNPSTWNPSNQQQNQLLPLSATPCTPYQSSNDHNNSFSGYPNNFPHHSHYTNPTGSSNSVPGNPNAFNHFDHLPSSLNQQHSHQQQQYHFSQPHGSHHNQQTSHNHGSTSSVSNFNLSSIFPEINDKRNNNSNNSNNAPQGSNSNSGENSSNNNCGYYSSSSSHGNARK